MSLTCRDLCATASRNPEVSVEAVGGAGVTSTDWPAMVWMPVG